MRKRKKIALRLKATLTISFYRLYMPRKSRSRSKPSNRIFETWFYDRSKRLGANSNPLDEKYIILRLRGFDRRINGHSNQLHLMESLVWLYADPINKSFIDRLAAKFWVLLCHFKPLIQIHTVKFLSATSQFQGLAPIRLINRAPFSQCTSMWRRYTITANLAC